MLRKISDCRNIRIIKPFPGNIRNLFFKNIDVLIVPSIIAENSPLTIKEALITNTPMIASRIGGIPEFFIKGMDVLLFKSGDSEELYNKLKWVLEHPAEVCKLSKRIAVRKQEFIFSIEKHAELIEELYHSCLK